jgi:tryptophan-rich sensory protein
LAKTIFAFLNVALVALYAIGSGLWVNSGDGFYRSLKRPFWQPPDFLFGLAWPYNFLVLIIAGIFVANNANSFFRVLYTVLFAFSVGTALLWAYSFYIQHNLILAAISLAVTALLTIPMVAIAFQTKAWFGLILIPYQLWLIVATSLSIGYQVLNKG